MRAYSFAKACGMCTQLPRGDATEKALHLCGKLVDAMYGARDAAQTRQRKRHETVQELRFKVGTVSPLAKKIEVCAEEATPYLGMEDMCNCLGSARPDLQFAAMGESRWMAKP